MGLIECVHYNYPKEYYYRFVNTINVVNIFELMSMPSKLEKLYEKGMVKYHAREMEKARKYFAKVLKIDPRHKGALEHTSSSCYPFFHERELDYHNKLIQYYPADPTGWENKCHTFFNEKRYEDAVKTADEALLSFKSKDGKGSIHKDYEGILYEKILSLESLNRIGEIVHSCESFLKDHRSIKIQDKYKKYKVEYDAEEYRRKIMQDAKGETPKPSEKLPKKMGKEDKLSAKGWDLRNKGLHMKAIAMFDKALKINPKHVQTWNYKSKTLIDLKRYEEAITTCDQVLTINPSNEHGWINKGWALHNLKRYDEAISLYNEALKINPINEQTLVNKIATLIESRLYEDAIIICNLLIKMALLPIWVKDIVPF